MPHTPKKSSSLSMQCPDKSRLEMMEEIDDKPANEDIAKAIGDVISRRYNRRSVLKGVLGVTAIAALLSTSKRALRAEEFDFFSVQPEKDSRYHFTELQAGMDKNHHVAEGYQADIFLRWGDPVLPDSPAFDPYHQTVESQLMQFGYNNDFIGFYPLGKDGRRGLLCVNHEYTLEELMFPELGYHKLYDFTGMTKELVDIEMAAHGGTVIEIEKTGQGWKPVLSRKYNRRINCYDTVMKLDGPAAGHDLLKTTADPEGRTVIGTMNNCAGGITPWGTYLMSEENFHLNFYTERLKKSGKPKKKLGGDQKKAYKRYHLPGQFYCWGRYYERYNIDKEPNEPNRFGWVVEVDILNPDSIPVKHTAMGRFCHEGCENIIAPNGHCVVYMGDDTKFEFVYKFISKYPFQPDGGNAEQRQKNMTLLSEGTLYAARFNDDGRLDWLPLVHGQNGLTAENGFASQAEVLIYARMAASQLGATPMDRPEDIEPGQDGKVYVMLTNNSKRKNSAKKKRKHTNAANPREKNSFGHIIEIIEENGDHSALRGRWDIMVQCGDPGFPEGGARWHPDISENGWFGSPDNCAIDAKGRLWVATDQGRKWDKTGKSDGLYALETQGAQRGMSKLFYRTPIGAELCGPRFLPDLETLFLSVQHPGADGTRNFSGFNRVSHFKDPATRWPDFKDDMPPRPSVVMITKKGGGQIG